MLQWSGFSGEARGLQCGVVVVVGAEFRGRAPGQAPLKLKSFQPSEDRGTRQICDQVKYSVNYSNIFWKTYLCLAIAVIRASQLQGQGLGPGGGAAELLLTR